MKWIEHGPNLGLEMSRRSLRSLGSIKGENTL